jgi:predicted deacylase
LIKKSLRETAIKRGKNIIVFEGGEALRFNEKALKVALSGTKKVIDYLNMKQHNQPKINSLIKFKRKWLRAPSSGFFHPSINIGDEVTDQQVFGKICGPYGDYQDQCISSTAGHIISLNNNPLVSRGDAIIQIAYD